MSSTDTSEIEKPFKAKVTLFSVAGLSVLWLFVAFGLGWYAKPVNGMTYQALTANEWGDFLAGVFAPVAFLWVAVAVFLQSVDLRAQLTEIRQTRDVLRAQADSSRQQSDFLKAQTDVMIRESELLREERRVQEFHFVRKGIAQLLYAAMAEQTENGKVEGHSPSMDVDELLPEFFRFLDRKRVSPHMTVALIGTLQNYLDPLSKESPGVRIALNDAQLREILQFLVESRSDQ